MATTAAGPGGDAGGGPRRAVALAVLLALTGVSGWRGVELSRTPPPLSAHGERAWMAWSHRHPQLEAQLSELARQLPPDRCVTLVVPGREPPGWWHIKALYHLPRHRVVAVRHARRPEAPGPECLEVVRRRFRNPWRVRSPAGR